MTDEDRRTWKERAGGFERRKNRAERERELREAVASGNLRIIRVAELSPVERQRYALVRHAGSAIDRDPREVNTSPARSWGS